MSQSQKRSIQISAATTLKKVVKLEFELTGELSEGSIADLKLAEFILKQTR